jgi:uncharacterized protein
MNDILNPIRDKVRALARQYLVAAHGAHQFEHTQRVVKNALMLAQYYPNTDLEILEAAAWLHDIGRGVPREKGQSHAQASASKVEAIGAKLGLSDKFIKKICRLIREHSYSTGCIPDSLESKILQDADRLDALGAIGIARTFAEGYKREMYHTGDPFAKERQLDDARYTLDHFYVKLLKLADSMHTPQARSIAQRRTEFLRSYLDEIARELSETSSSPEVQS